MRGKSLLIILVIVGLLALGYKASMGILKARLEERLTDACSRAVKVESVRFTFPLGIRVEGLTVPRIRGERTAPLSADAIQVNLLTGALLQGSPGVALDIQAPKLRMDWNQQVRKLLAAAGPISLGQGTQAGAVALKRVTIRDGQLIFLDQTVVPEVPWIFQGMDLSVTSGTIKEQRLFSAAGELGGPSADILGRIQLEGSTLPQGPGEIKLSLGHQKIRILAPYIRKVLGTAPHRGSVELESRITFDATKGLIIAENELTANGIHFPDDQPTRLGPDGNRLAELLSDPEGNIHLGFVVTGKRGEPLDWSDLVAGALRQAMRQALARGIRDALVDSEQVKPLEDLIQKGIESLGR